MRFPTSPYWAFAAFGLFWGAWGAVLPALKSVSELTDTEMGVSLLFVGLGALPAMFITGRAVDRFGVRVAGLFLIALAGAGVLLGGQARDMASMAVGMLLVGAASGAADVAANALAALGEARSRRRVVTLGHAVFSAFVVVGSLGVGLLRVAGAGVLPILVVIGVPIVVVGATVFVRTGPGRAQLGPRAATSAVRPGGMAALVAVGAVGALGFAIENAHQSWSAIFLEGELSAGVGVAALAPAAFAAAAAITRFVVGTWPRISEDMLLTGGALVAAVGTLIVASAQIVPVALAGLAMAAVGTSVLFPTLLSRTLRHVPDETRGRATSIVSTTAYLGFVLGPVYVGFLAGVVGLRGAMLAVALLAIVFAAAASLMRRT